MPEIGQIYRNKNNMYNAGDELKRKFIVTSATKEDGDDRWIWSLIEFVQLSDESEGLKYLGTSHIREFYEKEMIEYLLLVGII